MHDFCCNLQIVKMSTRLSVDEENFLKLTRIILDELRGKLRNLFITEFERKYGFPYGDDPAAGTFFLSNVLLQNRSKDAGVRDKIQNGDSNKFDCTSLFYCILYSGALLQPAMRRKDLRTQPCNSSELLDMLREHRNMFAHSTSAEINQTEFDDRVNRMQMIYQQLGWSCTDLQQAASDPLTTEECHRLEQALLTALTQRNALDQVVQRDNQLLLTLEGMLPIVYFRCIQNKRWSTHTLYSYYYEYGYFFSNGTSTRVQS